MKDLKITLDASFQLDTEGRPKYELVGDKRHYYIDLYTKPQGAPLRSVTYLLDPSYYDWKREVDNPTQSFREEITSYGDYNVTVHAQTPLGVVVEKQPLSTLLETHYSSSPNQYVFDALQALKKY